MGKSVEFQPPDAIDARRTLHTILGLAAWLPLALRIGWRLRSPHPRAPGQTDTIHRLAKLAHYGMLATVAVMLVSGPVLAWALTNQIAMAGSVHRVHESAATVLAILVLLHIGAALKHLMFHNDETVARIFIPRKSNF